MKRIGLTGGIGTGKSTAAGVFRRLGVPVFDADAAVRKVQGPGGAALPRIAAAFPGTVKDGVLDREALRRAVLHDRDALQRLEAIVHPLVRAGEAAFLARVGKTGARIAILDIPLLFETGGEARVDAVAVVSAPADLQRRRLRERGLDEVAIDLLRSRQMPDDEKRRRAHFVIDAGTAIEATRRAVGDLLRALAGAG